MPRPLDKMNNALFDTGEGENAEPQQNEQLQIVVTIIRELLDKTNNQ